MCEDEKLTGFVKNVADAIREVEGSSDQIRPVDFPERIKNLSSSSSSGFVYNVNTVNETSVPTADLEKLKSDPNAMIIETYTIAPVNFKIYYRKMFKSGDAYDRFVSVYSTANEEHINQTTLRAYRDLNYATSTLSKKHTVNIVNEDQLAAYLRRPTDNPTKDSLVAVSSNGGISWQPIDDFLQKDSTKTPYDQVYFKNTDGSNIMRNVRSVPDAYVMPITNDKGQLKTNDPEVELDCVNKQYLEANYNGNPALAGTEVELTGIMMGGTKYKVPNGGFVYKVTTSAELTIAADDLAKIKADNNAIIVEVDSTRPSAETRFYKKGIDFLGRTVFVSIYTVVGAEVAEGCSIAYRELNPTTGVLTARHETNATSLAEVRQEIEGKYLPKPSGNPTEDSLVKVSSVGTSSWIAISDIKVPIIEIPSASTTITQEQANIIINNKDVTILYGTTQKIIYRKFTEYELTTTHLAYFVQFGGTNPNAAQKIKQLVLTVDLNNLTVSRVELEIPRVSFITGEDEDANDVVLQTKFAKEVFDTPAVKANPTLKGTEEELTALQVGVTKYKIPIGGSDNALIKPEGNPTEDSLVKVASTGSTSWQPVNDFLARPTSAANSDRVCIVPDGQTKFGYKNAYKTVYNVENVFVIRDVRGTVPQPDPQREQDGVNLRYLQANYNGNPTLDGTEAELTGITLNGTKYKVPSGGGSGIKYRLLETITEKSFDTDVLINYTVDLAVLRHYLIHIWAGNASFYVPFDIIRNNSTDLQLQQSGSFVMNFNNTVSLCEVNVNLTHKIIALAFYNMQGQNMSENISAILTKFEIYELK